jgi:hypothetical protein
MKKLLASFVGAASLAFACVPTASAAEFRQTGEAILLNGDIVDGDAARLFVAYEAGRRSGPAPIILVLNSPGGDVLPGAKVAEVTRTLGLSTVVAYDDNCSSICMLVFAAGVKRFYDPNHSTLGVHSVMSYTADLQGTEDDGAMAATTWLARSMKYYGASDTVVAKLVMTPGSDMAWLTIDDLAGWTVAIDSMCALRSAAPAAGATSCQTALR